MLKTLKLQTKTKKRHPKPNQRLKLKNMENKVLTLPRQELPR